AEHAAENVDDGCAGAQRPARRSGHVGETGLHLHHLVERATVLVRSFQEALHREVDKARVDLAQILPTAFQPFDRARAKVLQYAVGIPDQPLYDTLSLRS